jgi:hypothetical protein
MAKKSQEEILEYMYQSEFLNETDVAEIQALPTIEERVAEARERISTRRDAAKAAKGIPVGTNQPMSAQWSPAFLSVASKKDGKKDLIFFQHIDGMFKASNKKVIDYRLVDSAVKILSLAGRAQGLWATNPEENITLYNAITYGSVDTIRQYLSDEMLLTVTPCAITEKMNGLNFGEICYQLDWYKVGHSLTTQDNFGSAAVNISKEIWDAAFEKIGVKLYRDTIYRVYGEFYGPNVQGGGVYSDQSRWYVYDVRVGNYPDNDKEHGWWEKENVGKLVAALQSLGVANVDFAHVYSPRTVAECINDCKVGFKSNFRWKEGTNLASIDEATAPNAEGYVMDFFLGEDLAGPRYAKLKVRFDMFDHSNSK